MLEMPSRAALALRLEELRGRYPGAQPEAVAEVVQIVLSTMRGTLTGVETTLLAEVEELGRSIASAKAEIAALKVDDITASHIPSATDELDAIVAHTAAATDSILEVCETLDRVGATLSGEGAQALQDATTRIYEACSFQDVTGQRIRRAIQHLQQVETMLERFLPGETPSVEMAHKLVVPTQMTTVVAAKSSTDLAQADIDALLN